MADEFLNAEDAARRLGIRRATLYDWLADSNGGHFMIRNQPVVIDYMQGGRRGQGRIRISVSEIDRLMQLMRVTPASDPVRAKPQSPHLFRGISVRLGRPDG